MDLLILDEADWHLFDDLCILPACRGVIGMSATSVTIGGGNESMYLAKMMFEVMQSGIACTINPK